MSISDVISGAASEVFSRSKKALDIASFTLLTKNSSRTLDLEVQHADISTEHGAEIIQQERDAWEEGHESSTGIIVRSRRLITSIYLIVNSCFGRY